MLLYVLILLAIILLSGSLNSRINCNEFMRLEDVGCLKTGDLIFTRHRNFASKLQQWALGSPINHIAMVLRIDGELWIFDVDPKIGAYVTPFADFVKSNFNGSFRKPQIPPMFYGLDVPYIVPRVNYEKGSVYVKRLTVDVDEQFVLDFVNRNIGRPFSFRFWCAAASRALFFDLPCNFMQESEGMFCSEIIYALFAELGIVAKMSPRAILPIHFWEDSINWTSKPMKAQQFIGAIKEDALEVAPELVGMILRSATL